MGIAGVGLAAVAGGEDPDLRGQFRWHVDDGFSVVDQALRQVAADAVASFDRPYLVGESTCGGERFVVSGLVRGKSAPVRVVAD
ncbi:hypothetical protein [Nocardia pseudobrasiliensis]|uniref:hypothetical protein n=1 Tax=Nocardia pseudobrasiliensis TaxID=45979 RepID=UPI0008309913|nr:hypothetical protein [Nocardia pseudobrasiliensis]